MEYAVAVFEFKSIAFGIRASDDVLKASGVSLVTAQAVCPGKFELLVTGELAQVQAASERMEREYEEYLLDSVQLGRVDEAVMRALLGGQPVCERGAVGIIETYTVASSILAADKAVKTANVQILELRVARGMAGKGYVAVTGQVADVQAAVDAGEQYAQQNGVFAASTVIPAPHEELWEYL